MLPCRVLVVGVLDQMASAAVLEAKAEGEGKRAVGESRADRAEQRPQPAGAKLDAPVCSGSLFGVSPWVPSVPRDGLESWD